MTPSDLGPNEIRNPFTLFSFLVPRPARVLITAEDDADQLRQLGYDLVLEPKDLRLLHLSPESIEGIWWNRGNEKYTVEEAFRILQIFFRGLKPKSGVLVFTFTEPETARERGEKIWEERTVMTLLRQTALQLVHTYQTKTDRLYFCQRL